MVFIKVKCPQRMWDDTERGMCPAITFRDNHAPPDLTNRLGRVLMADGQVAFHTFWKHD